MKVKYHKLDDETRQEGFTYYPLLRAYLRHQVNLQYVLTLVDSGSPDCLFPASIAELLCLDLRAGAPHKFHGFDNRLVTGFVHTVNLQVAGFSHWIPIDAVFLETEGLAILGQRGFFDNYQVVFEKWTRQFEINTKTDAMLRNRRGYGRGR